MMEIVQNARFIVELANRLEKDVQAHEEDRVKDKWDCHAGRNIPKKKSCIQADIRRLRRELMVLYRQFED